MMFRNQSWQDDPSLNQTLLPRHLEYCKERAIPEEIAKAARLYSVTRQAAAQLLGRSRFPSSGMVVPYLPTAEGGDVHCRIRLDTESIRGDGKPMRWVMPGGSGTRPYILPWLTRDAWQTGPVIVVEGPPKALSVYGNTTILTLALGGVETAHDKEALDAGIERLHPEILALTDWKDRDVFICFDSNRSTKTGVLRGEKRTARCFENAGAIVRIMKLPNTKEGKDQGPDDYISKMGVKNFLAIMEDASPAKEVHQPYEEIKMGLHRGKSEAPKPTLFNLTLVLSLDPRWDGVIAYNKFANRMVMRRTPPWDAQVRAEQAQGPGTEWSDADDMRLAVWMEAHWGISASTDTCSQAATVIAMTNTFHPVREYLDSLVWDEISRLKTWMQDYLGAEVKDYTSAVGIKFLVSMIARVMKPGCKADCLPIFEGEQGLKKSTAMRVLSKGWFTDQLSDIGNKDAAMELQGVWLVELSEFDYLVKHEASALKAFFGREDDRFRLPYGRRVERVPRQCVFAGTTNEDDYLRDSSGARRYWPVKLGWAGKGIDIEALTRDVDQLWAEALHMFKEGERWWLEGELAKLAKDEQDSRYMMDAWENRISAFIEGKTWIEVGDVMGLCLEIPIGQWKRNDEMRVSTALKHMGWARHRESTGGRRWGYSPKSLLLSPPPTGGAGSSGGQGTTEQYGTASPVAVPAVPTSNVNLKGEVSSSSLPLQTQFVVGTVGTDVVKSAPAAGVTSSDALTWEEAKVVARYHQPSMLKAYPQWQQSQLLNIAATHLEMGKSPMAAWLATMEKVETETESAF